MTSTTARPSTTHTSTALVSTATRRIACAHTLRHLAQAYTLAASTDQTDTISAADDTSERLRQRAQAVLAGMWDDDMPSALTCGFPADIHDMLPVSLLS